MRKTYVRPLDLRQGRVDMAHGSGGRAMAQLIEELFARHLGNDYLAQGDDGALLPAPGAGQKLVILADDPDSSLVLQALAAGAAGCCNTHAAPAVLRQVALVVSNGGLWIGQNLLQQVVGSTSRLLARRQPETAGDQDWAAPLSARERQVARLVAGGASNREVAERLAISERTAKAHLTSIFEKLEVRDRLQLSLRVNSFAPPDR